MKNRMSKSEIISNLARKIEKTRKTALFLIQLRFSLIISKTQPMTEIMDFGNNKIKAFMKIW